MFRYNFINVKILLAFMYICLKKLTFHASKINFYLSKDATKEMIYIISNLMTVVIMCFRRGVKCW